MDVYKDQVAKEINWAPGKPGREVFVVESRFLFEFEKDLRRKRKFAYSPPAIILNYSQEDLLLDVVLGYRVIEYGEAIDGLGRRFAPYRDWAVFEIYVKGKSNEDAIEFV